MSLSLEQLLELFTRYSDGYLFRGQTKSYVIDGAISVPTSFTRLGCVPPEMQKWIHYSSEIIKCMWGPECKAEVPLEFSQALLQHYGWRSFFIDATADPRVASWFASHQYDGPTHVEVTEDCYENGLLAKRTAATYNESKERSGFIYIISKKKLEAAHIALLDLSRIKSDEFVPRYIRQAAWLLGPCDSLPPEAIECVLEVPRDVLAEVAKDLSVEALFPSRHHDYIYRLLLSVPFVKMEMPDEEKSLFDASFGPYRRSIEIPEYDYEFVKINSGNIAFYWGQMMTPTIEFSDAIVVHAPESFMFHVSIDGPIEIENVMYLLRDRRKIVIECKGLLRWPPFHETTTYQKGAFIEVDNDGMIVIGGLSALHPGSMMTRLETDNGWTYKYQDGTLTRDQMDTDCPCNYDRKHEMNLAIFRKLNFALMKNRFVIVDDIIIINDLIA